MGNKYQQIQNQLKAKEEAEKAKTLKEVVKNPTEFKKDMAKFYGVNPGAKKDVDLELHLGQKGKENESQNHRQQSVQDLHPHPVETGSQKSQISPIEVA